MRRLLFNSSAKGGNSSTMPRTVPLAGSAMQRSRGPDANGSKLAVS
jgi:hypothetical protein